jgi:tripartite motif-containing protein 71
MNTAMKIRLFALFISLTAFPLLVLGISYEYAGEWGSYGDAPGEFKFPWDVAVSADGLVYVADSENRRIQCFSSSGVLYRVWSGEGAGTLIEPYGLAVGPSGNVYVADLKAYRIKRFTAWGEYLGGWGYPQAETDDRDVIRKFFFWPFDVAVNPGGDVFMPDAWRGRVGHFTAEGELLEWWLDLPLGDPDSLDDSRGIAVASDGTVYVVDLGNYRVLRFDPAGKLLGVWGSRGSAPGEFIAPGGIAIGADGTVFVADSANDRIQFFTAVGEYLGEWGKAGKGAGEFEQPEGVAVAPDGTVYVSDLSNHRVQYFKPAEDAE